MSYFLFRRRTAFLLIAAVVMVLVAKPTLKLVAIGLPLIILGEAGRLWCTGYLSKLQKLITAGPYALCRNPIYVSMFLITLGYFTICNQPAVWIAGGALFILFYGGAVSYEEKLLREKFGEEFDEYCKRVPRFIPRFRSMAGEGSFSWRQVGVNKELKSVGATVLITAVFIIEAFTGTGFVVGRLISLLH